MIDKIKIGYKDYNITYDDCLNTPDEEGKTYYGQIDHAKEIILINPQLKDNKYQYLHTLLHELLHGIFKHSGASKYQDEDLIELISSGLVTIIRDNNIELKFNNKEEAKSDIDYSKWKNKWVWCWDINKNKKMKHKFDSYSPNHNKYYPFVTYDDNNSLSCWINVELVEDEE